MQCLRTLLPMMQAPSVGEFQSVALDVGSGPGSLSDCASFLQWRDVLDRCRGMSKWDAEVLVRDGVLLSLANLLEDTELTPGKQAIAARVLMAIVAESHAARLQLAARGKIPLLLRKDSSQQAVALCVEINRLCRELCSGAAAESAECAKASGFRSTYDFQLMRGGRLLCSLSLQGTGRMHSAADLGGFHLTGGRVWAGSLLLVKWFETFGWSGRRVLELGAGLGFAGLALAKLGHSVVLSDQEPVILDVLESNVVRNRVDDRCEVLPLAWGSVLEAGTRQLLDSKHFDVVMGADVIYELAACDQMVNVLRTALPSGGVALFCNARFHRRSKSVLGNVLRRAGFQVRTRSLPCTGIILNDFCGEHEPGQEYLMLQVSVPKTSSG